MLINIYKGNEKFQIRIPEQQRQIVAVYKSLVRSITGLYANFLKLNGMIFHAEKSEENSETLLMACSFAKGKHKNKWFLGTDCNHMCRKKRIFSGMDYG